MIIWIPRFSITGVLNFGQDVSIKKEIFPISKNVLTFAISKYKILKVLIIIK
jgi:hypothetical protein